MGGGWEYPKEIDKGLNLKKIDDISLIYYHDQMHIFWKKLEEGYYFGWTFLEITSRHREVVDEMSLRNIPHIFPINNLDNILISFNKKIKSGIKLEEIDSISKERLDEFILENMDEGYSIEKKQNGFHISTHKKGNEVKIFSEQKKDLTVAFPTLVQNIKKLSDKDFIIDGELVPYDEKGNILGRNALMKYTGAVKSGKTPDDSNIKLHIWDIPYYEKDITNLPLIQRIDYLSNLEFNNRVLEIERKIINKPDEIESAVNWATNLKGSEGAVVKNLNDPYYIGENSSWKKYRHLSELNVIVIKKISKERGLFNYLVGVIADKDYLDKKYIVELDNKKLLVLGHTFNTKSKFNQGDKIKILIEEVWRHKRDSGIHYSIHKPRVSEKTEEKLSTINDLEDLVTSIGVEVTHSFIEENEVLNFDDFELEKVSGEGKEIEIKNFPQLMQEDFRKQIGKWNNYIMHIHTRGKTLHYDIRHKVNNHLQGITLFGRSTTDRLKIETQRNNIRSTIKVPQPIGWINFEGITHKGGVGATKKNPGIFTIISKGKYTISEVTDHLIHIEYKSDKGKINRKIIEKAKAEGFDYVTDLPNDLIDLEGKYSWHIAHIRDKYIILFDTLKSS